MNGIGWILLVALTLVGLFGLSRGASEASGGIDGPTARKLTSEGARLVDVRTPAEFSERHLPGAVNVPLQVLEQRLGDLGPKDAPIVLYCRSGNRSAHAASLLRSAGFTVVYDLGAIDRW